MFSDRNTFQNKALGIRGFLYKCRKGSYEIHRIFLRDTDLLYLRDTDLLFRSDTDVLLRSESDLLYPRDTDLLLLHDTDLLKPLADE